MFLTLIFLVLRRKKPVATNGLVSLAMNARRYYAKASRIHVEPEFKIRNLTTQQYKTARIVPPFRVPYNTSRNLELLEYFCGIEDDMAARDACTLMQVLMVQTELA